jgi:hypothetical protein
VILNTPLYRFYTENNKFETLNMIKPIKLSKKDNYDVDAVEKKIELNYKKAKNAVKNSDRISEYYNQINKEDENNYIAKRYCRNKLGNSIWKITKDYTKSSKILKPKGSKSMQITVYLFPLNNFLKCLLIYFKFSF